MSVVDENAVLFLIVSRFYWLRVGVYRQLYTYSRYIVKLIKNEDAHLTSFWTLLLLILHNVILPG